MIPEKVINEYFKPAEVESINAFGNGHIHNTYKVETSWASYIFQRINTSVFTKPDLVIHNHLLLQDHLQDAVNQKYIIPEIVKTREGKNYYSDENYGFWRVTNFIENSYSIEKAEHPTQAYEAGEAYGWFIKSLHNIDVRLFEETICNFHNFSFRLGQFEDAIAKNIVGKKENIKSEIDFYLQRKNSLLLLEKDIISGKIPPRIVHNDTKINNILFEDSKAKAVIDLDTVGPGSILYDYGDALRTIANTSIEDEDNLEKVKLQWDNYCHFTEAFLKETKSILTESEKQNLHIAPILMTYIIGIRFLTDYLNGDVYFKTTKPNHNLIRTRVQIELLKDMEMRKPEMKTFISDYF